MTTQTHIPLAITADSINDMVTQSRTRALEARAQVTELTQEEIQQVDGGAIILGEYFPHGIIEPRLANQFVTKPIFDQRLVDATMNFKY